MLSEKIFLLHILPLYMFIFINEFSLFVCLIKGSIFIHMFDTLCTYQGHTLVSLVTCATPLFPWFDRFGHTSRACQFSPLFIGSWSSGFYFCHQCVWQSGFHIWTVTMKWLGTLQLRRWHISDGDQCFWEAVALHCCESGREWWKWKGMGRSEIYKWGFMLAVQITAAQLRLYRTLSLNYHTLTYSQIHCISFVAISLEYISKKLTKIS